MEETVKNIKTLFEYFNGGQYLSFIVFIIATIYIWLTEKDKRIRDFFTWYTIIVLLIIWNPLALNIFNKFINFASMYRLYYMLPLYVTIAFAFTRFISNRKDIVLKCVYAFLIVVFICFFSETNVFMSPYKKTYEYHNFYKLPDESVKVADIIYNDTTYKEKKAIVPYGMSSHIQQVHVSIDLLYTRIISSLTDEDGNPLPTDSDDPSGYGPIQKIKQGDTAYIDELCRNSRINYVVLEKDLKLQEPMENYDFKVLAKTDEHIVYIRKK